jgi:hypothetical protein
MGVSRSRLRGVALFSTLDARVMAATGTGVAVELGAMAGGVLRTTGGTPVAGVVSDGSGVSVCKTSGCSVDGGSPDVVGDEPVEVNVSEGSGVLVAAGVSVANGVLVAVGVFVTNGVLVAVGVAEAESTVMVTSAVISPPLLRAIKV